MSDGTVRVRDASDGKLIDNELLADGSYRQRVRLGGEGVDELADVKSELPASDAKGLVVRHAGTTAVTIARATTATRTNVTALASDQLLLAANAVRLGVVFYNDSDSPLCLGLGTTPTTLDNFSILISARTEYFLPLNFIGEIRGIWQVAVGDARITELTT